MLFLTLAGIFKNYSLLLSLTTTLLFVVHPIHTEVVANIKSRDEILCLLFVVLTLFFTNKFLNGKKNIFLVLAAGFYFLAFLSKESAITLLAVIPLMMWFFHNLPVKKIIFNTLPFIGSAALYMLLRFMVLGELKGSPQLQLINNSILGTENIADRFATAISIMGKYLYLLVIPHPLSFDYSYNQIPVVSFGNIGAIISLLVIIFLVYLAFAGWKKKSPVAFGIIYFFATISLVSNILFLIESTMAERFLYIPSLGIIIAASFLMLQFFGLLKPNPSLKMVEYLRLKPVFTSVLCLLLLLYSYKTISRSAEWKDNIALLEQDVKTAPGSARIRYAYGSALLIEKALKEKNPGLKQSYLDKSIVQLEKGVSILPNYAEAWNHLGIAYKEKENYAAAINAFEKARSYKEFKDAEFYISTGLAYGHLQKYDLAIAHFTKAISIDPANAEAYNNKGLYLFEKGSIDSSIIYFDKAISLKKGFYQAYYNKGNTVARAGKFNEAIVLYNEALKHNPDYTDAWLNMGNSYAALNDYTNALKYFRMVEAVEPNNKKVVINIGITYRILGDEANATLYFDKAGKLP